MSEKNFDLKIQYAVLKQPGYRVINQSANHFLRNTFGAECDHLTSLLKIVTLKYLNHSWKTYGKRYTEMVVHKNIPSFTLS